MTPNTDSSQAWGELRSWCHTSPAQRSPTALFSILEQVKSAIRLEMVSYVREHNAHHPLLVRAQCLHICVVSAPTTLSEEKIIRAYFDTSNRTLIQMTRKLCDRLCLGRGVFTWQDMHHPNAELWQLMLLLQYPTQATSYWRILQRQADEHECRAGFEQLISLIFEFYENSSPEVRAQVLSDAFPFRTTDASALRYRGYWADLIHQYESRWLQPSLLDP